MYNHDTYRVYNLPDYIQLCEYLRDDECTKNRFIYRGHSYDRWALESTLSRADLVEHEQDIIEDFKLNKPDEYQSNMTSLHLLGKMQHYGYPTRIIDFTENPLVALYFACHGNEVDNGRVILNGNTNISYIDINFIEVLFKLLEKYNYHVHEKTIHEMDTIIREHSDLPALNDDVGASKFLDIFYNFGRKGIHSIPMRLSQRQKVQKAVALLFPNNLRHPSKDEIVNLDLAVELTQINWDSRLSRYYLDTSLYVPGVSHYNFMSIIIPSEVKASILESLALVGIDKSTLFPELEYSKELTKQRFR